ncbi:MAG TPA: hypothetical protein VGR60_02655 [Gemmatimonadales bacterium]|nr:hypothetical protein [Gemmatimonadales bacterium]
MHAPSPALRALLTGLVDYAGLFPPADLPMRPAVENYARYQAGDFRWALGRFVLPVARFGEFIDASDGLRGAGTRQWHLAALINADRFKPELSEALNFNERHALDAAVDVIELKATSPSIIREVAAAKREGIQVFVEVPLDPDPAPFLDLVQEHGLNAKGRTGGVTPESIPAIPLVARFLARCVERGLDFKCTAGLHHPIRADRALTYASDSPHAPMHGYVNVFLAAAFLQFGMPAAAIEEILGETVLSAFGLSAKGVNWRGNLLTADQISRARQKALAFGSCSFEEPIDDLKTAGLL